MTRYPNFRLSFFLFPYFIFTLSHFGFPSPGWFEITHHTHEFNLHITSSQQCWIHFNAEGLFFLLYEQKKEEKKVNMIRIAIDGILIRYKKEL